MTDHLGTAEAPGRRAPSPWIPSLHEIGNYMRLSSLKLPSWSKIAIIGAVLFGFRIMAAMAREHQELKSALLAHPIFGGLVLLTFGMAVGEIVIKRKK